MENFFLLFGVAAFSWQLCKFIFWLDEPHNKTNGGSNK